MTKVTEAFDSIAFFGEQENKMKICHNEVLFLSWKSMVIKTHVSLNLFYEEDYMYLYYFCQSHQRAY